MKSPAISVCVPIFNGERYLEACLDGIARQTLVDFEVLLVDDGSTDRSQDIAHRWTESDARFRLFVNEKNLGLVGNWNRCIVLATGEWIKFLFQDDLIEPECLAQMLAAGQSGGGFVACSRHLLYEGRIEPELKDWYSGHRRLLESIYPADRRMSPDEYSRAKLQALEFNIVGEPSVTLIARRLFEQYGLFDARLIQLCDSEMWNRLGSNVGLDYLARDLVTFRVHRHSATQTNRDRQFRSWALDEIVELDRLCRLPSLERFRAVARREGLWATLRRRLSDRTNAALDEARWASQRSPPEPRLQEELSAALGQLSGVGRTRLEYLFHRLKRRLSVGRGGRTAHAPEPRR